jgi:hypothetical protein
MFAPTAFGFASEWFPKAKVPQDRTAANLSQAEMVARAINKLKPAWSRKEVSEAMFKGRVLDEPAGCEGGYPDEDVLVELLTAGEAKDLKRKYAEIDVKRESFAKRGVKQDPQRETTV